MFSGPQHMQKFATDPTICQWFKDVALRRTLIPGISSYSMYLHNVNMCVLIGRQASSAEATIEASLQGPPEFPE